MAIQIENADELLSTTRAVRKRLDFAKPVPREVILDCIRISQQAPTGSNQQGWRWMVVTDAKKRAALAELCLVAGRPVTTTAGASAVRRRPGSDRADLRFRSSSSPRPTICTRRR